VVLVAHHGSLDHAVDGYLPLVEALVDQLGVDGQLQPLPCSCAVVTGRSDDGPDILANRKHFLEIHILEVVVVGVVLVVGIVLLEELLQPLVELIGYGGERDVADKVVGESEDDILVGDVGDAAEDDGSRRQFLLWSVLLLY
jgi:hypothetical protein